VISTACIYDVRSYCYIITESRAQSASASLVEQLISMLSLSSIDMCRHLPYKDSQVGHSRFIEHVAKQVAVGTVL